MVNTTRVLAAYFTRSNPPTSEGTLVVPFVTSNVTTTYNSTGPGSYGTYVPVVLPVTVYNVNNHMGRNFGMGALSLTTGVPTYGEPPNGPFPVELYVPLDVNGNGSWIFTAVQFTFIAKNATTSLVVPGTSIFPAACGVSGVPAFPIAIKFDSSGVFRVASLFNNTLCVATSSSDNPVTSSWSVIQYQNVSAYSYGFSYALWNGYQTACWDQVCHIIDPGTMQLVRFNSSTVMYAVHRGNYTDSQAPCGVFGALNGTSVWIHLCQTVNFTSGTITFNVTSISVPLIPSPGTPFSTYIRVAHGRNGRFAYAYVSNLTTANSANLYIGEYPGQPIAFSLVNSFVPTSLALWTWDIVYDCRDTLYITANGVSVDATIARRTFHLATDPPNALVQFTQTVVNMITGLYVNTSAAMPNAVIDTNPLVSRAWFDSQVGLLPTLSDIDVTVSMSTVLSERHNVVYTARDACNTTMTCNQTVYLTTVAPCG